MPPPSESIERLGSTGRRIAWLAATLLATLLAAAGACAAQPAARIETGRALFTGELDTTGHLRGDTMRLRTSALRCINCHARSSQTAALAPALSARTLLEPVARRGGPPTRYDRAAFCQVLRNGIDPAGVLLARTMPQYQLSADQCTALWDYLVSLEP